MGGSGKTPMAIFLAKNLAEKYEAAILSRGYGRRTKGYLLADDMSNAESLGDEPYMMFRRLNDIPVAVCEDRVMGVLQLLADRPNTNVVLLDDVFQHRHIKPGLKILLTEYDKPYCDDLMLPAGNLREFEEGQSRADIVVVTKCPHFPKDRELSEWKSRLKLKNYQKLFFALYTNESPKLVSGLKAEPDQAVVLVTGIAHSSHLKNHIASTHQLIMHFEYSDHHLFTEKEIGEIASFLENHKIKTLFTTEKDWFRLEKWKDKWPGINVFIIPVEVKMNDQMSFINDIEHYIKLTLSE